MLGGVGSLSGFKFGTFIGGFPSSNAASRAVKGSSSDHLTSSLNKIKKVFKNNNKKRQQQQKTITQQTCKHVIRNSA